MNSDRKSYKKGLALGLLIMMLSGFLIVQPPPTIVVNHAASPRGKPLREIVTPRRAQFYGASLFVIGAGLVWLSCYMPPNKKKSKISDPDQQKDR